MQRHTRAADFIYERFATCVHLIEIRRTERRFGGAGKNEISHAQIADRTIHRIGGTANFLRDAQRRLARFVGRTDVAHDCGIDGSAVNHHGQITDLGAFRLGESPRDDDVRIGRANQETEFLQLLETVSCLGDRAFQLGLPRGVRGFLRRLRFK